ncbi:MAG TPA: VWA domain-containing protein [Thermoanaerobaculia bacterium]|nr:VWA domain-containing protein [Thermoanaerobaculia bacterium]
MIGAKARGRRSGRNSHRRLALGAGLLALPLLPLLAATPPATPAPPVPLGSPQRFEESTQVVSVEVPVNAVDRAGKPVRGLTAADFEVFDEGARQTINHFEVVDLDSLRPDQAAVALAPGAIGTVDDLDAVDAAVRRHFLLLFDFSFSSPTAVLRARLAARDFVLKSLRPTDLVAVATTSLETGPRLVLTFTPDRAQLAHAIDTLGLNRDEIALGNPDPLRFILASPSSLNVDLSVSLPSSQTTGGGSGKAEAVAALAEANSVLLDNLIAVRAYAQKDQRAYANSQITAFTRGLGGLAKALDSLKGRKTVVYFSQGFDSTLLLGREDLGSKEAADEALNIAFGNTHLVDTDQRFGNTGLKTAVNRMLEEFRRADCVIQAIDISGLRASSDATDAGRASGQEALFYMANETGGELFKDANNFGEQLERVLERTNITYLLAFQRSDLKADGAYHRLRVKTRAGGVRLSYRTGYYAPRPYKQLDPLEKNLLAADGIARAVPRNGLDIGLLVAPFRASEKAAYVPVIIELPGPSLMQGEKADRLNLELYAYVSNGKGQMADFFTRRFTLDVKKGREALQSTGVKYYGHLDLPAGDYRVRVLVRDSDSGRTGVRSVALSVPTYQKLEPVLLPPLFIEGRHHWVLVRERAKEAGGASVVYPFTLKGEPYVPAARPSLGSADKARLCLVGYNLGAGELALEGHVTAADGSPLSGGDLTLVERTASGVPGQDELLATFQPTGLGAGDYVLRVALIDRKTGHKEVNSLPFQVVR